MLLGLIVWTSLGLLLGRCACLAPGSEVRANILAGALAGGADAVGGYLYRQGLDPEQLNLGGLAAALAGALSLLAAYHIVRRAFLQ